MARRTHHKQQGHKHKNKQKATKTPLNTQSTPEIIIETVPLKDDATFTLAIESSLQRLADLDARITATLTRPLDQATTVTTTPPVDPVSHEVAIAMESYLNQLEASQEQSIIPPATTTTPLNDPLTSALIRHLEADDAELLIPERDLRSLRGLSPHSGVSTNEPVVGHYSPLPPQDDDIGDLPELFANDGFSQHTNDEGSRTSSPISVASTNAEKIDLTGSRISTRSLPIAIPTVDSLTENQRMAREDVDAAFDTEVSSFKVGRPEPRPIDRTPTPYEKSISTSTEEQANTAGEGADDLDVDAEAESDFTAAQAQDAQEVNQLLEGYFQIPSPDNVSDEKANTVLQQPAVAPTTGWSLFGLFGGSTPAPTTTPVVASATQPAPSRWASWFGGAKTNPASAPTTSPDAAPGRQSPTPH